jgi:hypothetical protein
MLQNQVQKRSGVVDQDLIHLRGSSDSLIWMGGLYGGLIQAKRFSNYQLQRNPFLWSLKRMIDLSKLKLKSRSEV